MYMYVYVWCFVERDSFHFCFGHKHQVFLACFIKMPLKIHFHILDCISLFFGDEFFIHFYLHTLWFCSPCHADDSLWKGLEASMYKKRLLSLPFFLGKPSQFSLTGHSPPQDASWSKLCAHKQHLAVTI